MSDAIAARLRRWPLVAAAILVLSASAPVPIVADAGSPTTIVLNDYGPGDIVQQGHATSTGCVYPAAHMVIELDRTTTGIRYTLHQSAACELQVVAACMDACAPTGADSRGGTFRPLAVRVAQELPA